jgi:uncharacterized membrane protein YcaP (DUF421 family)
MDQDVVDVFIKDLFFPGTSLAEKIIRPVAVYIFLIVILRIGGRRELSQMNAFDLVVLLTLANAVQNAIIGDDNSLIGGFIGGAALVLLNLGVNWFLYRHPRLDRKLEGEPVPLVKDGRIISANLAKELITEEELLSVVHRQGVDRIESCAEVILETSGTITVLARQPSSEEVKTEEILDRLERLERMLSKLIPGLAPAAENALSPQPQGAALTPQPGHRGEALTPQPPLPAAGEGERGPGEGRPA